VENKYKKAAPSEKGQKQLTQIVPDSKPNKKQKQKQMTDNHNKSIKKMLLVWDSSLFHSMFHNLKKEKENKQTLKFGMHFTVDVIIPSGKQIEEGCS